MGLREKKGWSLAVSGGSGREFKQKRGKGFRFVNPWPSLYLVGVHFLFILFPKVEEHCMVLTLDFQIVNPYLAMFLMWFINEKFVLVGDYGRSPV